VHGHVLRQGYTAFIHRLYHAYDYERHVGVLMGARDKGVSPCGDPEEHTVMTPFWQTGSTLSPNFFLAKKLTKLNIARISGYIGIDMLYSAKAQLYRNFPFVAGNFIASVKQKETYNQTGIASSTVCPFRISKVSGHYSASAQAWARKGLPVSLQGRFSVAECRAVRRDLSPSPPPWREDAEVFGAAKVGPNFRTCEA
jgi:hypothetical protein